jgi:hypothetical protein
MRRESKLKVGDRVWGTVAATKERKGFQNLVGREIGTITKIAYSHIHPSYTNYHVTYKDGLVRCYHIGSLEKPSVLEMLAEL